jgi:hypothetical protein
MLSSNRPHCHSAIEIGRDLQMRFAGQWASKSTLSAPPFPLTVDRIGRVRAEKQVVRPHARRRVAMVEHQTAVGNLPTVDKPTRPMGRHIPAAKAEKAVAIPHLGRSPQPAAVAFGLRNLRKKPAQHSSVLHLDSKKGYRPVTSVGGQQPAGSAMSRENSATPVAGSREAQNALAALKKLLALGRLAGGLLTWVSLFTNMGVCKW